MARPHIVSQLWDDTDDTVTDTVTDTTVEPTTITAPTNRPDPGAMLSPPTNSTALAAFRAGSMDGEAGIEAGRSAALAVLGRGAKAGDGWDNEEDMEDGAIEVAGSRSRRLGLPNGRCVSSREFR